LCLYFFAQLFLKLGVGSGAFFKVFPQKIWKNSAFARKTFLSPQKRLKSNFKIIGKNKAFNAPEKGYE